MTAPPRSTDYDVVEGRSNWVVFAAVVLGVAGIMRIFDAIWAFRYDGALPARLESALFGTSLDTYGWLYLVVAAILLGCAWLLMRGSQFARWAGVGGGIVAAVSAVWWMPYYPIWSLTYIGIAFLVIYALIAHGGRPERA